MPSNSGAASEWSGSDNAARWASRSRRSSSRRCASTIVSGSAMPAAEERGAGVVEPVVAFDG
jgi:hypothetical protein